jgi:hypothetical protein
MALVREHNRIKPLDEAYLNVFWKLQGKSLPYSAWLKALAKERPESVTTAFGKQLHPMYKDTRRAWEHALKMEAKVGPLQGDHVFSTYLVKGLAMRYGIDPKLLLPIADQVIPVARSREIARRIAGYTGYAHSDRSRRIGVYINRGYAETYTLQQMRDASHFSISTLGGPNHPGLAVLDKITLELAEEIGRQRGIKIPLDFRAPEKMMFYPGEKWTYHLDKGGHSLTYHQMSLEGHDFMGMVAGKYAAPDLSISQQLFRDEFSPKFIWRKP